MKNRIYLLLPLLLLSGCNINTGLSSSGGSTNSSVSSEHTSHSLKFIDKVEPGEVKEGHIAYYECTVCKRLFLDQNGSKEISEKDTVIKSKSLFVAKSESGLNYCEYLPDIADDEKVPLVLFLHGAGERGNDNVSQLKNAIKEVVKPGSKSLFMDSVVLAPQCPSSSQWVDTPWENGNYESKKVQESSVMKSVVSLVEKYRDYEYVDANRVYVVGLSMGGFGAWDIIARHKDIFAAAVPICGGGPKDAIDLLKDFPIYTFHGTKDTSVPYSGTSEMVDLLKKAGSKEIEFVSYENEGHGIWDKAIKHEGDKNSPSLESWLFGKSRAKRIACIGDSLTYGHAWHDESYPVYLQSDLGYDYVVGNFGANGAQITGYGGLGENFKYEKTGAYLDSIKFSPGIILIMLGTNDATGWDNAKNFYEAEFKKLISNYQKKFATSEIVIMTSPKTVDGNKFKIPNDTIKNEVNPIQRKIAKELGLKLIDLRNEFENYSKGYKTLLRDDDGVHLSIEGAKFVANFIEKSLNLKA